MLMAQKRVQMLTLRKEFAVKQTSSDKNDSEISEEDVLRSARKIEHLEDKPPETWPDIVTKAFQAKQISKDDIL